MDELLEQIFMLAIKVNRETEKAVWAEYIGHVDGFDLRIAKGKKEPAYYDWEFHEICYFDGTFASEAMSKLKIMKEVLCGLLKEGKEVEK
jgi:hypothetical protein